MSLSWNTPVTIPGATANASDAKVVIDSNGNATAIWVVNNTYSTGTCSQSGTSITGFGTTFTADMVGGSIIYNGGDKAIITAFTSTTSLTTLQSLTVSPDETYVIIFNGGTIFTNTMSGGSWAGSATQLSSNGNIALTPKIEIDSNDHISAVWIENSVVNYAFYPDAGNWSSVTTLSDSGAGPASSLSLGVDNTIGNIAVSWIIYASQSGSIAQASVNIWSGSTPGSWPSPSSPSMSYTVAYSDNSSISTGNGITTVVWHANPTQSQDQILASTSPSIFIPFGSFVNIVGDDIDDTSSGVGYNYPQAMVNEVGNSVATWFRYVNGGYNGTVYNTEYVNITVKIASLLANAGAWGQSSKISDISQGINPANLNSRTAFDSLGNIFTFMTISNSGFDFTIESNVRQIRAPATGPFQLITSNADARDIAIAMTKNQLSDVLVTYTYYDGVSGNIVIQATETDIGAYPLNIYSAPITISTNGAFNENSVKPSTAITINGSNVNAVVVWEYYDTVNSTIVIQAATGSRAIMAAPTSFTATQNTVDTGVYIRYDNTLQWTSSSDINVIGTDIYRNGVLLIQFGQGPSETQTFIDTNVPQVGTGTTITYSVSAIDANYLQSTRVTAQP